MRLSGVLWVLLLGALIIVGGVFSFLYFGAPKPLPVEEVVEPEFVSEHRVIGKSVEGRDIEVYQFGDGSDHLLFVGGVHGGYEWNSVYLAYRFIDHVEENPTLIPSNMMVSVIPSLNPDGLYAIVGSGGRFTVEAVPDTDQSSGRFNANDVDLNRNFDCKWQPESTWRGNTVSAGTGAFSEPETQALRDFVQKEKPKAVVFWHSQANAVYASECENGILPETRTIMNAYAQAADYPAVDTFDAYSVTGDAEGWLASIGIPAITVELSSHDYIEWDKNIAGVKALLSHYGK